MTVEVIRGADVIREFESVRFVGKGSTPSEVGNAIDDTSKVVRLQYIANACGVRRSVVRDVAEEKKAFVEAMNPRADDPPTLEHVFAMEDEATVRAGRRAKAMTTAASVVDALDSSLKEGSKTRVPLPGAEFRMNQRTADRFVREFERLFGVEPTNMVGHVSYQGRRVVVSPLMGDGDVELVGGNGVVVTGKVKMFGGQS